MTATSKDIQVVRDLAKQYAELAAKPIQAERRRLWSAHHSLKPTRPLILATYGMWNVWCREVFGDAAMTCQDPFYRHHERMLRMQIFHDPIGDDYILEPWVTQGASVQGGWGSMWGLKEGRHDAPVEGGAWQFDPPIREWADAANLRATPHTVDEVDTARNVARLHEAVGDILPIDVPHAPCYHGFGADISTFLARLRGLEPLMLDMYEHPRELHRTLAFMRDGILANNQAAEDAGHYSLTAASNQAMPYADELEWMRTMEVGSAPRRSSR